MKNSTQSMPCPPSMSRRWLPASAGIMRARLMLIPHPYPCSTGNRPDNASNPGPYQRVKITAVSMGLSHHLNVCWSFGARVFRFCGAKRADSPQNGQPANRKVIHA